MLAALLALASFAQAACPETTFTFVGQPACVGLAWEGGHTRLDNRCDAALLVDQSVLLPRAASTPIVPARAEVELRDLSAFTLGMEGRLYRVVAVVEACEGAVPR